MRRSSNAASNGERRRSVRLAFVGWGAIAQAAAALLPEPVEIVAVAVRDPERDRPNLPPTARLMAEPTDLADLADAGVADAGVDVVAEAAGRASVEPWGRATLEHGVDLLVSSVSAFADAKLLSDFQALATRRQARLQIHPGAVGGIDALAAARAHGLDAVEHQIVKPPLAWRGTAAEERCDLDGLTEPTTFYTGTAADTAERFPKNANVAMTTALAGVGAADTTVALVADPAAAVNKHRIVAEGAFGRLDVTIANNPLPGNPQSSAMAALSLARAISNRTSALVI